MTYAELARMPSHPDVFAGSPRGSTRKGWQMVLLRAGRQPSRWMATVRISCDDAACAQDVTLVQPRALRVFGIKLAVVFLDGRADQVAARLYNAPDAPGRVGLSLVPIPPFVAALGVYLQNGAAFWKAFRSGSGFWTARVREGLASAAYEGQRIEADYNVWTWSFDSWNETRLAAIAGAMAWKPSVSVVVFCATGNEVALAATIASVRAQVYAAEAVVVARPGDAGASRQAAAGECVAVLQAGEVLPRHALLLLADEMGRQDADALLADEDRVSPDGTRTDPWFKPQPSLTMMCSGLLSRGVWLVRSPLFQQAVASLEAPAFAACVQLAAWFVLQEAGRTERVRRVPRVLTHRRADAEAAPPAVLAKVIDAALRRSGVRATVAPEFPLRLRWHGDGAAADKVSLIVTSRLRGDVQLRCKLDILERTSHRNFDMLVVVTQDGPLDEEQLHAARRLAAAGPARVVVLRRGAFNYSLANNFGASLTQGDFLCLLNDDVSTLEGGWLGRMLAVFSDRNVGIVGAKLYYPDMTTQHGGVVMGLAGLAEHASRFLPRGEPGYMWRGVLDQEFSAVTGACLLVRRELFERIGGLDESLPTAFNDVEFCLRARAMKYSIVMAACVELVHHETISFGHHYAHAAERERADVALMQERWRAVCEADPFHNPNLSLVARHEWTLASPPRVRLDESGLEPGLPSLACWSSAATGSRPPGGATAGTSEGPAHAER